MTSRPAPRGTRALAVAGAAAGVLLLGNPERVLEAVAPAFPRERRWLVRALGARLVAQHGLVLVRPDAAVAGAAVDALHAASMLPFLASARYGRAARVSGGVALASALAAGRALVR
ncbi:hypothetical protein [Blastococcus sp. SYSU D01042]